MTLMTEAEPRLTAPPRAAIGALVRIEARRMLRHPAPWLGLVLVAWWVQNTYDQAWTGARYTGLVPALTPLLLGISLASLSVFGRERVPVADDAPMDFTRRSYARLLAGTVLVTLTAVVVVAGEVWLRLQGGLDLGDEPGRTLHAHYTLPELIQPVLLAALAVAVGAAMVHLVRQRLVASIMVVVGWFLLGATYWLFDAPVVRWLVPVQPQPVLVEIGPWDADPTTFPETWLLSAPGEYQDFWGRLVVSPAVAAWHDVYLVGVIAVLVGVAVPGRLRPFFLTGGLLVAVGALFLQQVVAP